MGDTSLVDLIAKLASFVAAGAYVIEYAYVYSYLLQLGATPEEVGLSQLRMLTRAALLGGTLFIVLALPFWLLYVVLPPVWSDLQATIDPKATKNATSPGRGSLIDVMRAPTTRATKALSKNLETHREKWAATGVVLAANSIALFLVASLLDGQFALYGFACATVGSIGLLWVRKTPQRAILVIGLVCWILFAVAAAVPAGGREGTRTVQTGKLPDLGPFVGLDIRAVTVEPLRSELLGDDPPPEYLMLGRDSSMVVLYDCSHSRVHWVPATQVHLTRQTSTSPNPGKLQCNEQGP